MSQFFNLAVFDWRFIAGKKSFGFQLIFFLAIGLLVAMGANFPFPETFNNSPYVISYVTGILSLVCIISVSIIAAQSLFREQDANFQQVLYATPVTKKYYLGSRLLMIFMVTAILFTMLIAGLMTGQQLFRKYPESFTGFHCWFYLQPLLVLGLPNILLSVAVICGIGSLTRNRMLVYIAGVFLYFAYWGISIFSNSPLIAGSSPASADAMQRMAILDPFGLAAFFEQTRLWTAGQRNTQTLELTGNFLINRIVYLALSLAMLWWAYTRFRFRTETTELKTARGNRAKPERLEADNAKIISGIAKHEPTANREQIVEEGGSFLTYKSSYGLGQLSGDGIRKLRLANAEVRSSGWSYELACWRSFLKIDSIYVLRSVALWVIVVGWMMFAGIELYSDLAAGSRFPARIAGTTAITGSLLKLLPVPGLLMILFFGSELWWRSRDQRFEALENVTPAKQGSKLVAKWMVLAIVPLCLVSAGIIVGCILQLIRGDAIIEAGIYASLYYLVAFPQLLSCGLVICVHALTGKKYLALSISTVLQLVTNTSLGEIIAVRHPLLQFARSFEGKLSEINGYDFFLDAFNTRMLYWGAVTILIVLGTLLLRSKQSNARWRSVSSFLLLIPICAIMFFSGYRIYNGTDNKGKNEYKDWQQLYESKYKRFEKLPIPVISIVDTEIDLYPSRNMYTVKGKYLLINNTSATLDSVLVSLPMDLEWSDVAISNTRLIDDDKEFGHRWYRFLQPVQPGDSLKMNFKFSYKPFPFKGFGRFNNILHNGSFLRISNFFPRFGYNTDLEISNADERKRRRMPVSTSVPRMNEEDKSPGHEYGYIQFRATISTDPGQQVVSVGRLTKQWSADQRAYFRFETDAPIPFRFALSSASYSVKTLKVGETDVNVYYHPSHARNTDRILQQAQLSLSYYVKNFGPYPYRSASFAEISDFTNGFAATAYPGSFFMNESFGFTHLFDDDTAVTGERDIINEQVAHELSHNWWGNAMISPVYQQGSAVLTETLAMYSELMVYKQQYGEGDLVKRVKVHYDLYLSQRGFEREPPLYLAEPGQAFLNYDKGMVVMYQLYKLMGEERINRALRLLLARHRFPLPPPATPDLVSVLKESAEPDMHKKIDELFIKVVVYDLRLEQAKLGKQVLLRYRFSKFVDGKTVAFDESVDVKVSFEDGSFKIIPVANLMKFDKKVIAVEIDPEFRFGDLNVDDNSSGK